MAQPLAAGVAGAQIAQQTIQDQAAQQVKQGPSKFDGALKSKEAAGSSNVQAAEAAQQVDHVRQVETVAKTEKTTLNKVSRTRADPVSHKREVSKSSDAVANLLADMEKGGKVMDRLINGSLSGKNLSNHEMLAMQAGMFKYTQELELTGKVVEKATTGLKETLKTQV